MGMLMEMWALRMGLGLGDGVGVLGIIVKVVRWYFKKF